MRENEIELADELADLVHDFGLPVLLRVLSDVVRSAAPSPWPRGGVYDRVFCELLELAAVVQCGGSV